jgi:hypothetical protein
MSEKTITCPACGENASTDYAQWSSVLEKSICESCWADDFDNVGTVHLIDSDGTEKFIVGDLNITNEYGGSTTLDITRKWVSTDGWRGYHDTTIGGWVTVLRGWTTGGWDDPIAERKRVFNSFAEELMEQILFAPCEVAIITDTTSNLFSTGISVQVKPEDKDQFIQWLNESEYPYEDLERSLS